MLLYHEEYLIVNSRLLLEVLCYFLPGILYSLLEIAVRSAMLFVSPGMTLNVFEIAVRRAYYCSTGVSYSLFEIAVRSACYFLTGSVL